MHVFSDYYRRFGEVSEGGMYDGKIARLWWMEETVFVVLETGYLVARLLLHA